MKKKHFRKFCIELSSSGETFKENLHYINILISGKGYLIFLLCCNMLPHLILAGLVLKLYQNFIGYSLLICDIIFLDGVNYSYSNSKYLFIRKLFKLIFYDSIFIYTYNFFRKLFSFTYGLSIILRFFTFIILSSIDIIIGFVTKSFKIIYSLPDRLANLKKRLFELLKDIVISIILVFMKIIFLGKGYILGNSILIIYLLYGAFKLIYSRLKIYFFSGKYPFFLTKINLKYKIRSLYGKYRISICKMRYFLKFYIFEYRIIGYFCLLLKKLFFLFFFLYLI